MNEQEHCLGIPEDDPITWWRAHAAHLRSDLNEVCIPAYNGLPYAPVEVVDTTAAESHHHHGAAEEETSTTSALRRPADWDCWPEVSLQHDSTRAFAHIAELAHHRECAETSCITVWANALQRRRSFGARTFVFATSPIVSERFVPTVLPIDNCAGRLKHLRWTGMTIDDLPPFYEVAPHTADDLRAQRMPTAPPLDPTEYVNHSDAPPQAE